MRNAANGLVKMAKVSRRVPDTSVRGSRSFRAESKSKPACLHRHGAREVRYFEHKHPNFLTPPQEQVYLNKLTEKNAGVTGHFKILFSKNRPFLLQYILKQAFFGHHFEGEAPRNLTHVFLRTFENGFNNVQQQQQKTGMFMVKYQKDVEPP